MHILISLSPPPAKLTPLDFAYPEENIPEIKVMGETACWAAELEEQPTEEDLALLPRTSEGEEVEAHDRNAARMDQAEVDEVLDEEVSVRAQYIGRC